MTSKWVRQLERLGAVQVEWDVFSLEIANSPDGADAIDLDKARGIPVLRTALAVEDRHGNAAMGRFYSAVAGRTHDHAEKLSDPNTVRSALADVGLDGSLYDEAQADNATWEQLKKAHAGTVEQTSGFGVPIVALADGSSIFGPVISEVPSDADALRLLDSTVFLTGYANFAEFKRERTVPLDLEGVRRRMQARNA